MFTRYKLNLVGHFAGVAEYTDCFCAGALDLRPQTSVLDNKQSDGVIPVMLELCGMQRTPSLLLLPSPV